MTSPLLPPAVWQSLHFDWLWVYHGQVPVTERWSDEIVVPAGWFWVESGEARMRVSDGERVVKPGQSFFTAPGTRRQWFAEGTRLLSVGFRCQWPGGMPVFQDGLNCVLGARSSSSLQKMTRELFQAVHGRKREVTYLESTRVVSKNWADWCRQEAAFRVWLNAYVATLKKRGVQPRSSSSAQDRRLEWLMNALQSWPLDQPLQLAQLTAGSDLGERRIHDLLKQHLGLTAQAWLEQRRLQVARDQLTGSNKPLKEIAFQLGFRHPPHFTTWFKRHTHLTPTAFRAGQGSDAA